MIVSNVKYLVLSALFLYVFSGCSKTVIKKSDIDTTDNHYASGIQKLAQKDVTGAEADFLRAIELEKKSPKGYTGMALLELSRAEYKKALKRSGKALKYDSNFVDAHIARGRILTERKKGNWFDDALASFENALKLDPENEKALFYCGDCYLAHAAFSEALDYYSRTVTKQGSLKDRAAAKHSQVSKVIEASPVSEEGKKRILYEKISRSDLCVLLVGELKLKELLASHRPVLFEEIYNDDYTVRKGKVIAFSDDKSHISKRWIQDIIPLHISDLDVFPNGNFYPDRLINRAQLAMIIQGILSMLNNNPTLATQYVGIESGFPDVRPDFYAFNAIMLCVQEGILEPEPSTGAFKPENQVSGTDAVLTIRNIERLIE